MDSDGHRDVHRLALRRCFVVWVGGSVVLVGLATVLGRAVLGDIQTVMATVQGDPAPGMAFDTVIVQLATVALLLCVVWLWIVGTSVVLEATTGRLRGIPAPAALRRLVLAACGLGLAATALPAGASTGQTPSAAFIQTDGPGVTAVLEPLIAAAATAASSGEPTASSPRGPDDDSLAGLPLPDRAESSPGTNSGPPERQRHPPTVDPEPRSRPPSTRPQPEVDPARGQVTVRVGQSLWSLASAQLPGHASDADITRVWNQIYQLNREAIGPDPDLIQPGLRLHVPTTATSRGNQP